MAFARASAFLSRRMRHGLSCELCLLFTQRYNKKCIMQAFMSTFCVKDRTKSTNSTIYKATYNYVFTNSKAATPLLLSNKTAISSSKQNLPMGVAAQRNRGIRSYFAPRKVRFLAMTMLEQAQHCSFGLTKTAYLQSYSVKICIKSIYPLLFLMEKYYLCTAKRVSLARPAPFEPSRTGT